ncbi:unnamed protein product [Cylicostephanus goldi]|uniref:IBR domain-containing protein n=1 Tax=Cylicostephanus goldi TaxID=71465 RepID=A0A3P6SGQ3_CYLGO|nr:unnamed protein product [Cylicostephanus goldi]
MFFHPFFLFVFLTFTQNICFQLAALELIELSLDEDTDLGECPGCNQAVEINQSNEYGCVHCKCGVVWCSECKKEPHWPMSCDTASEWAKRWLQQGFNSDALRKLVLTPMISIDLSVLEKSLADAVALLFWFD